MSHNHNHNTTRNIRTAFLLNLSFALLEIFGGIWTNSLAILSDAIHDLGDSFSLGLAWYLEKYSEKERNSTFTYGYRRFSLLGALINTIVLIVGSIFILVNAIPRLLNPEPTNAQGMIIFALVGVAVNGLAVLRLRNSKSMNVRVVALHLIEDVFGWVAVLIMSIILLFTDYYILDPILSILFTGFILFNVVKNLRKTLALFLQAAPDTMNIHQIEQQLLSLEQVQSTHHTHIWSLDGEHHVLSTHVVLADDVSKNDLLCVREEIKFKLKQFDLSHSTIEIEFGEDDCMMIDEFG
ncbi:MAG: cation diffusion facilitator family transporter [Chloroflexota bacterium]|nr:cation diffusion facilitator family transporter [Chloroflexota bacterium]